MADDLKSQQISDVLYLPVHLQLTTSDMVEKDKLWFPRQNGNKVSLV